MRILNPLNVYLYISKSTYRLLHSFTTETSSCTRSIPDPKAGTTHLGRPTGRLGSSGCLALAELRRLSRIISPISRVMGITNLDALSFGKLLKIYAVKIVDEEQTSLRTFASTGRCYSLAYFLKLIPVTIIKALRPP